MFLPGKGCMFVDFRRLACSYPLHRRLYLAPCRLYICAQFSTYTRHTDRRHETHKCLVIAAFALALVSTIPSAQPLAVLFAPTVSPLFI